MSERRRGVALVGALEIVQRRVVVGVLARVRHQGARWVVREGVAGGAVDERALGRGARTATGEGIGGLGDAQRAGREITAGLQHRIGLAIADEDDRVALVVGEVRAHRDAEVGGGAVAAHVARQHEVPGLHRAVDLASLVMVEDRTVDVDLDALEAVVHDEVDHAGHGVGTVHRRGPACQHVHVLDQRRGNLVQVRGRIEGSAAGVVRVTGRQASAVDEHQRARGAKAAQVQRGRAGGAVGHLGTEAGEHLRQAVHEVFDRRRAGNLDRLGAHRDDRRRGIGGDRLDARTRDLHARVGRILRQRRQGAQQQSSAQRGHDARANLRSFEHATNSSRKVDP